MNKKFFLSVAFLLSIALSSYGQLVDQHFTFDIDNTGNGILNDLGGVAAYGGVDFLVSDDQVVVNIINDSTVASSIVGFYILKPIQVNYELASAVSSDIPQASLDKWGHVDDGFHNVLNTYFNGNKEDYEYLYFGAETQHVIDGLNNFNGNWDPHATFTFNVTPTGSLQIADWAKFYADAGDPHIFVRWRESDTEEGSSKGYAYFDGGEGPWGSSVVPVPEPSEVALLAMLGLGGLIFARRRLIKK